ncbi:hypothetical protein BDD21_0291 [Thiocapsa rosea]|uniref:Uncharacterized protein n=1 Tax=Thiocapsa rosea TaxID=69360 RepID=A0A495V3P0_9GAMM|nr:hypothetical protein BDD21_0291 [Thiocapsa rosea]
MPTSSDPAKVVILGTVSVAAVIAVIVLSLVLARVVRERDRLRQSGDRLKERTDRTIAEQHAEIASLARFRDILRIPRHSATCSTNIRPAIPPAFGHPFHDHSAGQSERSDAGGSLLLGGYARRQPPGVAFAHRLAFEGDPVGVVDQAVEDRIGEGGIPDQVMPMFDRQLAGDERGALAVAVVEQIAAGLGVQPDEPPVVEQQQIGLGEAAHELGEAAVGMSEAQSARHRPVQSVVDPARSPF